MNHYIYIVHPIRFLEQNEPTYKIGKTTTDINKYLNVTYQKGTKTLMINDVPNCHKLETEIIEIFDKIFVKRKDIGLEYYTGDIDKMKDIIANLIQKQQLMFNALKQRPKILQYVRNKQEYLETLLETKVHEFDELEEFDKIGEVDDLDECDNISDTNGTSNINPEKSLSSFYKYIHDTKPEWYIENTYVSMDIIEDFYRKYFNDQTTTTSVISRQLNGYMFSKSTRVNRTIKKKLISYVELRKLF